MSIELKIKKEVMIAIFIFLIIGGIIGAIIGYNYGYSKERYCNSRIKSAEDYISLFSDNGFIIRNKNHTIYTKQVKCICSKYVPELIIT